jgi:hypothetical protein
MGMSLFRPSYAIGSDVEIMYEASVSGHFSSSARDSSYRLASRIAILPIQHSTYDNLSALAGLTSFLRSQIGRTEIVMAASISFGLMPFAMARSTKTRRSNLACAPPSDLMSRLNSS